MAKRLLEVIEIAKEFKSNKKTLTLYDTKFDEFTKKIWFQLNDKLTDNLDGALFTTSLMNNLKYRQNQINLSLASLEAEIISQGYTLSYTPEYTELLTEDITEDAPIDYDLLTKIVANEKDFFKRDLQIKDLCLTYNIKFQPCGTLILKNKLNEINPKGLTFTTEDYELYGVLGHHKRICSIIPPEYLAELGLYRIYKGVVFDFSYEKKNYYNYRRLNDVFILEEKTRFLLREIAYAIDHVDELPFNEITL